MNRPLDSLLQHPGIWRGGQAAESVNPGLPTGFADLDQHLPGGGWPLGALTEILSDREGIGELRLVMPALARLSQEGRWLAWVAPPHIPYAPALAAWGVNLSRILLIHPRAATDGLWAVEQALRSGTCGAVLAWPAAGDERSLRRLQLAAEEGKCWGLLFRSQRTALQSSPAAVRLGLETARNGKLAVHILKRRGGWATGPVLLDPDAVGRNDRNERTRAGKPATTRTAHALAVPPFPPTSPGRPHPGRQPQ